MIPETTLQLARDLIALQARAAAECAVLTAAAEAADGVEAVGKAALAEELRQVSKVLRNYIPRLARHIGEIDPPAEETPVPIGEMEIPEEIVIPQFLSPSDPLDSVPASLLDLVEPEETAEQMQARIWAMWLELNGKLMLGLASAEEIALHTKLHNELHWFAPPVEDAV